MAKTWTEEHEQFIRENFRTQTYAELAEHFGVSQKAMESKIRRLGLKKQDYKDPDPMPSVMPPPKPEEEASPVETGPTPIRSGGSLPRQEEEPAESEDEREARLQAEREAAEQQKERREERRSDDRVAAAIEKFEEGLKKYHDGSLGKARDAFKEIVESGPPDPVMVARSRQYIDAIERRGRSAGFEPQDADEHYLLGVVRLNDGDPTGALEAFAEALDMAPGDDRILYCQAAAHAQSGDIEEALSVLRDAVDINDANRVYATNDPDFVPLRVHEDFREIISPDEED